MSIKWSRGFSFLGLLLRGGLAEYTIHKQLAKCELESLRLGSEIADVFNSLVGDEDWVARTHQDFITEHLGFAPWLAKGVGGKTITGSNSKQLQEKGNWSSKALDQSAYSILNHKWVYMFGDSTTRQVWASYAAPFQGNHFERNSKEWTRQYCNKQGNRVKHVKNGRFPEEGWRGPCGVNEVTCHVSGYGEGGLLTFDWKHFPYEDYDNYVWSEKGPWQINNSERRPDILTIQSGLHTCWHSNPQGLYSKELLEVNQTMVDSHIADIPRLMSSIRKAIERPTLANKTSTVIVLTSGFAGFPNTSSVDECIVRVNRAMADAAHKEGFAVLERGEIERRIMFKSAQSSKPYLTNDMHLPQPAQNIVATCLLLLMGCLTREGYDLYSNEVAKYRAQEPGRRAPEARPLHTPP